MQPTSTQSVDSKKRNQLQKRSPQTHQAKRPGMQHLRWISGESTRNENDEEQENRLRTTQRAMERRILGISLRDKTTSSSIRQQTQFQDAIDEAKKRKLRWAGHIARREDNRWTKIATTWEPKVKAPKGWGKPLSWKQQITEIAGKEWMETAQDREKWRSIVNGQPPHQKLATRASG
ncbi:putative uncharacterized transposon-derived protein F52C9.6 [Ditylenchus destructor]|uniref:Uncharacterized transposon-derived protein F52C9.6 n=1 Tax=Ditylenchus destructor TaxID=166010 RepID=A0AAD4N140_9BILA|nr:putative uncharacterized transposon-derived protein F52C9.6 [Ditylenchus destructor]